MCIYVLQASKFYVRFYDNFWDLRTKRESISTVAGVTVKLCSLPSATRIQVTSSNEKSVQCVNFVNSRFGLLRSKS